MARQSRVSVPADQSRIISPHSLVDGHGFSFKEQKYLGELFNAAQKSKNITFVVGAGISINSGLPSWEELVERLCLEIDDPLLARAVIAKSDDLARKSELAIQIIRSHDWNAEEHQLVKRALYPPTIGVKAGQIANALARIIASMKSVEQIGVITTNFDEILEAALLRYLPAESVRSFTLSQVSDWKLWVSEGKVGVLHVHGLLPHGIPSDHPRKAEDYELVFTESQFLRHGADVRTVIADAILDSVSIFVGLSLTDPNLIGSLYEVRKRRQSKDARADPLSQLSRRFFLGVVDHGGSPELNVSARLSVESARSLERVLELSPIILKSYSQLVQVLSDIALAIKEPERYRRRPVDGSETLHYGHRFSRALDSCYTSIGCKGRQTVSDSRRRSTINGKITTSTEKDGTSTCPVL